MATDQAPQDRSEESAPNEQRPVVRVSYEMLVALKDEPLAYHNYMNAGSDLAHAKVIAKIIAGNPHVESVMLVEYEHVRKRLAWCSVVEQSTYALAVREDTEQVGGNDPVERDKDTSVPLTTPDRSSR